MPQTLVTPFPVTLQTAKAEAQRANAGLALPYRGFYLLQTTRPGRYVMKTDGDPATSLDAVGWTNGETVELFKEGVDVEV